MKQKGGAPMLRFRPIHKLLLAFALLSILICYIVWGNVTIGVTVISVPSKTLPEEFSGFRIAQISDLHNEEFGECNAQLLKLLAQSQPDLIVLTGDIIDSYHTDVDVSVRFIQQATQIAPAYYVTGNHESRLPGEYAQLKAAMLEAGVTVLENEITTLARDGAEITLIGVHDPKFTSVEDALAVLAPQARGYTILLSHRPELMGCYAGAGVDLVFSGHAHGGQIRLPFIGGLLAPHQGWFPAYTTGLYTVGDTNMIVSRGLGNSSFPVRFNNRPELVIAQLETAA